MRGQPVRETDLYAPVKEFLEGQGYAVRGEVGGCDALAVRDGLLVAVELKLSLNLRLLLQAVKRLGGADAVYVAFPAGCSPWRKDRAGVRRLLRMLGLGLLLVDPASGLVQPELDPGEYRIHRSRAGRGRLLREHAVLVGDPNTGGSRRRGGVMTLYRRNALAVAGHLRDKGPSKASDVSRELGMDNALSIMYRNVYGWFQREGRGVYALSPRGRAELPMWE